MIWWWCSDGHCLSLKYVLLGFGFGMFFFVLLQLSQQKNLVSKWVVVVVWVTQHYYYAQHVFR